MNLIWRMGMEAQERVKCPWDHPAMHLWQAYLSAPLPVQRVMVDIRIKCQAKLLGTKATMTHCQIATPGRSSREAWVCNRAVRGCRHQKRERQAGTLREKRSVHAMIDTGGGMSLSTSGTMSSSMFST